MDAATSANVVQIGFRSNVRDISSNSCWLLDTHGAAPSLSSVRLCQSDDDDDESDDGDEKIEFSSSSIEALEECVVE